jgi:SPP1 family predicted phage head-tail adaptor
MLQTKVRRGELDREVYLIKPAIVDDTANAGSISGWDPVDTDYLVFARKKELPGKELVVADRLTFVQTTIFTIVYRTDLTTRNRIVFNTKPYEIISIHEDDARGMYLHIYANVLDTETWDPEVELAEGIFDTTFDDSFE